MPAPARLGLQRLGLGEVRDAAVFLPSRYETGRPAPLVVLLHGAGADADDIVRPFLALAERTSTVLLAPDSRGRTWDVILDQYGPDVAFIDRALTAAFERYALDPARLGIAGFSDGASYALSLGIANGELFPTVLAFSPGFMAPSTTHGTPRIFVTHGVDDTVLPIERCSRKLVPVLQRNGYSVDYREFDGGHELRPALLADGFDLLLRDG